MSKESIFACSDIDWQALENTLREMKGQKGESTSELDLLDLAVIKEHVEICDKCRKKLGDLAEEYKIDR